LVHHDWRIASHDGSIRRSGFRRTVRRAAQDDFNLADDSEAASRICGVDFADFDEGCDANPR
jgi:hypothetical protein